VRGLSRPEAGGAPAAVIGRDAELGLLDRALRAAREGRGSAVFVVGEDGIGKSCLALEFGRRAAAAGASVLRGRTSSVGPVVPFRPLAEALQRFFRSDQNRAATELGPYQQVLGMLVPDCRPAGAGRAGPSGRPGESVLALAEAILRLAATAGRDRGCLLILEDLQDADAGTLAVVEYLADNLDRQPAVVVATIRADPSEALELARAAARRHSAVVVELGPLAPDDMRPLAARCLRLAAADVPGGVAGDLFARSGGNPLVAVELLCSGSEMPAALVRCVGRRVDRLGPGGRALLTVGAVLGHRFPLPVVRATTGHDERELLGYLHAAVAADLIRPVEPSPDWYAFRQPMTAPALLHPLTPAERAWIAGRAAEMIEVLYPELPGEWCELAAALLLAAGDQGAAARLLAAAGDRALAEGAFDAAVATLSRAYALLSGGGGAAVQVRVLDLLLAALAETGHLDRARQLAGAVDELDRPGLDAAALAALRTRLGWLACIRGDRVDGASHLDAARALLGPQAGEQDTAPIDVVAAHLARQAPGPGADQAAEQLAKRAAAGAARAGLPAVACQAWQLLGVLARQRDVGEATECFERVETLAGEHSLPMWRLRALAQRGINDWLTHGDTGRLDQARRSATARGAVVLACGIELDRALCEVLLGRYAAAEQLIDGCRAQVDRLQLAEPARQLAMIRAVLAAHQGQRREMDEAVGEFRRRTGEQSRLAPLMLGLASTFCALLEEDRAAARRELARAIALDSASPASYPLTGRQGLHLLLEVLSGHAGWTQYRDAQHAPASRLRWNRQFVLLARAVLLGRDGRAAEATTEIAKFEQVAAPFAMTRPLGLRLAAEAAQAGRWGEPAAWLRRAEEHFRDSPSPGVASACRATLRQIGAFVPQRRNAGDLVPKAIRRLGVTVREYEVLRLLADRPGNRTIAERLYISPRTVEKHVASLIAKVGQPNRAGLCEFALALRDSLAGEAA
jgi:DNA-binding CsgD family transcriptional regulator